MPARGWRVIAASLVDGLAVGIGVGVGIMLVLIVVEGILTVLGIPRGFP